jgi:tryptophan synthase alpha chain
MGALEARMRAVRDGGGKAFAPYVTGGYPGVDATLLRAVASVGADMIEVGIPHSDPIMDGGVIQRASAGALAAGATVETVLATIEDAALDIPVAVMTYANLVLRHGPEAFARRLAGAGVSGAIVPDLPVDEARGFATEAAAHGIDEVLLAAPGSSPERLQRIADRSHGFVYCVATYGVTGTREELGGTAAEVVGTLRPMTDLPLFVGVGIGTPEQAAAACAFADGTIVGSALMRALIDEGAGASVDRASAFRAAIA